MELINANVALLAMAIDANDFDKEVELTLDMTDDEINAADALAAEMDDGRDRGNQGIHSNFKAAY